MTENASPDIKKKKKKKRKLCPKAVPLILMLFFLLFFLKGPQGPSLAHFSFHSHYKRNKKIWGTYALNSEKVTIKRGKLLWRKYPSRRTGDLIISKGKMIFIRETKINKSGETKVVVDKISYKRRGKDQFINKDPLERKTLTRLFGGDLLSLIPQHDLFQGSINYKELICTKNKRGRLSCELKGEFLPQT